MDVAVSLGAQAEYTALNEKELNKGGDAEHDMDEDGRGGVSERLIASTVLARAGAGAGVARAAGVAMR